MGNVVTRPTNSVTFHAMCARRPTILPSFRYPFGGASIQIRVRVVLPHPFTISYRVTNGAMIPHVFPPSRVGFIPSFLGGYYTFNEARFGFSYTFFHIPRTTFGVGIRKGYSSRFVKIQEGMPYLFRVLFRATFVEGGDHTRSSKQQHFRFRSATSRVVLPSSFCIVFGGGDPLSFLRRGISQQLLFDHRFSGEGHLSHERMTTTQFPPRHASGFSLFCFVTRTVGHGAHQFPHLVCVVVMGPTFPFRRNAFHGSSMISNVFETI